MARLVPHTSPEQIDLDPERRVAVALCEQLPKNVIVFHSYPWLRPEREFNRPGNPNVLREGEADFVIVHPRYGIMVVEVKGGHLRYDPATQRWDRAGATHPVKDPFLQAANNLHAIESLLKQRSFGKHPQLPFARARCVVFPHCDYNGSVPPGAHASILFGASDLVNLGQKIENLFKLQPFVPKAELSNDILDGITRGLTSNFQLVPALWSEIENQERRLFRFTEDQLTILKVLQSHSRAAIQGVAGSGKTVLAIAKARSFADEGKRVLFLCFNELLADWLQFHLPEAYRDSVTIRNYHKLCREWVIAAGLAWPKIFEEEAFFGNEAPRLLERAIDLLPDRCFDAVVVDEGQDFMPAWWDTVELINKRPTEGPLYIFFDADQLIFQTTLASMPALGAPFLLPVNCRNTERIASRCGKILGKNIPVNPSAPAGKTPKLIYAPNAERQIQEVEKQIKEWIAPNTGLKCNQVAVVTRGNVQHSSLAGVRSFAGQPVTENLNEWRSGAGILVTSLYRFKGLETDALILADVALPDPEASPFGFRPQHFYVACSRAKHLLTMVSLSEKLE